MRERNMGMLVTAIKNSPTPMVTPQKALFGLIKMETSELSALYDAIKIKFMPIRVENAIVRTT